MVNLQIFDSTDFSLLCSESSSFGERWVGGDFLAVDKVVVWSDKGRGYLYVLPSKYLSNIFVLVKIFHCSII